MKEEKAEDKSSTQELAEAKRKVKELQFESTQSQIGGSKFVNVVAISNLINELSDVDVTEEAEFLQKFDDILFTTFHVLKEKNHTVEQVDQFLDLRK